MNLEELNILAHESRARKEFGITLTLASLVLALALVVPWSRPAAPEPSVTVHDPLPPDSFAAVPLEAHAALVYDLATHTILYEKNATAQLPLASLTKLLTIHTALTHLDPRAPITISRAAALSEAPRRFSPGETLPLYDLAKLTLTASLNDGAAAIAEALATAEEAGPLPVLASAAAALDLSQTYVVNGSGLDLSPTLSGGYGSARDMALLAGALVAEAPDLALATTESSASVGTPTGTITVQNTDPIVKAVPHLLLSKTGFTDLAGGNLALVFDAGIQHPIAVVVLGSTKSARFTDGAALVAATLAHFAGVAHL
jgi:D-alanyl-D-alanine carboxypeptidase